MDERLYPLRLGAGWHIECGWCRDRQVLLGYTHLANCFVLHWFAADGRFLGLERVPLSVTASKFPGTSIYRQDPVFKRHKAEVLTSLKERLQFREGDIAVRKFESDEASILDLAGEYEEYLLAPEKFSPAERDSRAKGLEAWRDKGYFALSWYEEYWISRDGRVVAT